jgi:hypothetical protein
MSAGMDWLITWMTANGLRFAFVVGFLGLGGVAWIFHRAIVDEAVRVEREACAQLAQSVRIVPRGAWSQAAALMRDRIAAAIRARGIARPPTHTTELPSPARRA